MTDKSVKNDINKEMFSGVLPGHPNNHQPGFIDKILRDVSKQSASTQILMGAGSGWVTGFLTMKVGKVVAITVGGSIILLQLAHQQGYVSIDWSRITKKVDTISDKVSETVMGQGGPTMMDKAERFLDRKAQQVEDKLKKTEKKVKKWYSNLIGDENGPKINEFHIFVISFAAGVALGIGTA
jgi:FUN14 domain-containing protein 1